MFLTVAPASASRNSPALRRDPAWASLWRRIRTPAAHAPAFPGPAMRPAVISVAVGFAVCSSAAVSEPEPTSDAQRWLAPVGVPEFRPPATWDAWTARRSAIRATLWGLLGDFPARPAVPDVTVVSRTDHDGYVLEKFTFPNGLGSTVPGYLFLPRNAAGKVPAILYCHWHAGQYAVGKEEMLGTNATPVPPGPTLARLGFAVLGIDACCFGERNGQGPGGPGEKGADGEMTASKFSLWAGRTLWGTMVRDDLMALDYLCSRPEVDRARIGATGISLGSTRSWWLAALDDRIRTAVCVACMTRYQNLILTQEMKAHGIYYFVPGMLRHFDTEAVIACAAPRPMLFMTGDRDAGSPVSGIRAIEAGVAPVYRLGGADGAFVSIVYPDTGHVYLPEMWARMVAWMQSRLMGTGGEPAR
jgi:dienelactone hydrolase